MSAPWLCSSDLLSTVTDCGTSRRSAGSLSSDVPRLAKSLESLPAISTSCTPITAAAPLEAALPAAALGADWDQAGAAVSAISAGARGAR